MLSARDLVRQIPAEWQENVKHRRTTQLRATSSTRSRDPERTGELASWFWGVQEVPDILDRWGARLPPERVHLVTVPPPGAPPDLLWQRFAAVLRARRLELDLEAERANPSLGVPETAAGAADQPARSTTACWPTSHYRAFVRELLAHQTLSRRDRLARGWRCRRTSAPGRASLSASWIERARGRGVRRGRRPRRPACPTPPPRRSPTPTDRDEERGRRRRGATRSSRCCWRPPGCGTSRSELRAELDDARRELDRATRPRAYRGQASGWCAPPTTTGLGRAGLRGLPPGARQELAVGVAADLPGGVARRRPRPTRPPTTGTRRPTVVASRLPATLVISSEATSAAITRSRSRVVGGRGGERHRRRRAACAS